MFASMGRRIEKYRWRTERGSWPLQKISGNAGLDQSSYDIKTFALAVNCAADRRRMYIELLCERGNAYAIVRQPTFQGSRPIYLVKVEDNAFAVA